MTRARCMAAGTGRGSMDTDVVERKLAVVRAHATQLAEQIASWQPKQRRVLATALDDLDLALEELQVAQEALLEQNRALEDAQLALATERQRYHDHFMFAPDGYLVTDLRGIIREANQAMAALLHTQVRFLLGKRLALFVPHDEKQAFRSALALLRQSDRIQEWKMHLQ